MARFDDLQTGAAIEFGTLDRVISADTYAEVLPALAAVDAAVRDGNWAYGFVSYDAAPGIDPTLASRRCADFPLLWFGITDQVAVGSSPPSSQSSGYQLADWRPEWTENDHAQRVTAVRRAIAQGDTYQANLTTRLVSTFTGDPLAYYRDLSASQGGRYNAYVSTGDQVLISASPELFFEWSQGRLRVKPMKGTAGRGLTLDADEAARTALVQSEKDRAENVMIVDLVRNDLSRLARPGTVSVDRLMSCEKYDTVWQLTSTVSGEVPPSTQLGEIFTALFPCGSVTGAPKRRSMEIIADLETSARGPYCGTIGYLEPPARAGDHPRARFNVAIRTVVVDRPTGRATYGVGGAITWESAAADEYNEIRSKAALLSEPVADFSLIETFAIRDGHPVHLERHLDRLAGSADYFGIPYDLPSVQVKINETARNQPNGRARLTITRDGVVDLGVSELPAEGLPVTLAVDTVPIDNRSRWIYHKTTVRRHLDAARRRHSEVDDVVLVNQGGYVTESLIANLAVRIGDNWYTPPVLDGCLPGIGRRLALEAGILTERSISIGEFLTSDAIALVSSVRGWRPALVVEDLEVGPFAP